jgi:hypothetical protein
MQHASGGTMNIEMAMQHALNGHAILFTGSGCSMDAINLKGEKFKSANQLASYFATQAGIDVNTNLTIAAEEFRTSFGKEKLITELLKEFSAQRVHEAHLQLAKIPWRKIYTTNYDNVMEMAYAKVGKKLIPATPDQAESKYPKKTTLCVHLNGYIDQLNERTLEAEFKLTEGSYVASSVATSTWALQLRDDIRIARAVFFVGYSLYDIDIQRLLFESIMLKDKCIFIVGERPSGATVSRVTRFGEMHSISTITFAKMIDACREQYTPPEELEFFGECIDRYIVEPVKRPIQDKDIFRLFLYGSYKPSLISTSISDQVPYYRERPLIKRVFEYVSLGERTIVIHSELGNGKTLFIEGIKLLAIQKGFDVYSVINRTSELLTEIDNLTRSPKKVLLIFENYFDWFDAIKYFANHSSENSVAILSARTPAYDINVDELYEYLDTKYVPQINLNVLDQSDLEWVVNVFDRYGLWAERASLPYRQKLEILRRYPEFNSILLGLLRSPTIIARFENILNELNNRRENYQVLISILVLAVLNYPTSIDKLIDLWGDMILTDKFRNDPVIAQIIEIENDDILLRSSGVARFLLRLVADAKIIADTLIQMRLKAEEKSRGSDYFKTLAKNLVRFHNLQNVLPEKDTRKAVLYYYESIKNLNTTRDNPLFWLQYGIASLVMKEYGRAEKYLETAYSYARNTDFDVFQIDNHYARYLLERMIHEKNDPEYMSKFRKAKLIISGQMGRESRHFPYKVAQLYSDFYFTYEAHFSASEKREIAGEASAIITRISRLPVERQEQEYISRCGQNMQMILEKVSGI